MPPPSSSKHWVLATALACVLAGLLLKASEPVHQDRPSPRVAKEQPRRAVQGGVRDVISVRQPRQRADRRPVRSFAARPGDGVWLGDQPPPVVAHEGVGFGAAPPRASYALLRALPRAAARTPEQGVAEPVDERPAVRPGLRRRLRAKRRRLARLRRAAGQPGGGSTDERVPGDTSPVDRLPGNTATVPPPAGQPATVANTDDAGPDEVAFRSGNEERFPTDAGQVAIPIHAEEPHQGGSVSLWVQPGWERGNEDDATLVQLGDRLRLGKDAHFLRLETADADGPAGVGVPITDWNPGEWHHLAATWSRDAISLYVDGELVGRRVGGRPLDLPPDTELLVGSDLAEDRRVAPGLIGRVDVRKRPLEDDEVGRSYRDAIGADDQRPGRGNGRDDHGDPPDDRGDGPARGGRSDRSRAHESDRGRAR